MDIRGYIVQELHKLFNKLRILEHKRFAAAVERYDELKALKLIWIKCGERKSERWNYRISMFRAKTVKDVKQVAKLHGVLVIEVDPRGTINSGERGYGEVWT